MLTALFLLEIGLKVAMLAALWLIWRRMDRFQIEFDRMDHHLDDVMSVANSPLWFRQASSVNVNSQREGTSE